MRNIKENLGTLNLIKYNHVRQGYYTSDLRSAIESRLVPELNNNLWTNINWPLRGTMQFLSKSLDQGSWGIDYDSFILHPKLKSLLDLNLS